MTKAVTKVTNDSPSAQLYEAFAEWFQNPTQENFRRLLMSHIGEKDFIDFKAVWPEHSALAKHILAMGNSGGGAIVIGIKEEDDHTLTPVGLSEARDTADVTKGIEKYLPSPLLKSLDVIRFAYTASEYGPLIGKTFQMVRVIPDIEHTPFISRRAGSEIAVDTIYVRRGTRSEPANHDELQEILNRRIETRYSTSKEISLEEHLGQIKTLYGAIPRRVAKQYDPNDNSIVASWQRFARVTNKSTTEPNPIYPAEAFEEFVANCIERKKGRIRAELDI